MTTSETIGAWLERGDGTQLPLRSNCPIGRSPSNELVIPDRKVSRRHAVIHRQNGHEYWIVDLGSGNGTYVNGTRVSLPRQLTDTDTIMFGEFAVRFRQTDLPDAASRTAANPSMTVIDVRSVKCWMLLADIISSTTLAKQYEQAAWATLVGSWAGECRQIVDLHGGEINKYLGDGFLAIWPWNDGNAEHISGALSALLDLQKSAEVPFRLAVHLGELTSGGGPTLGEDNLTGFELIFLFRMEKLASSLEQTTLLSAQAYDALGEDIGLVSVGEHVVPGYVDEEARAFYGRGRAQSD